MLSRVIADTNFMSKFFTIFQKNLRTFLVPAITLFGHLMIYVAVRWKSVVIHILWTPKHFWWLHCFKVIITLQGKHKLNKRIDMEHWFPVGSACLLSSKAYKDQLTKIIFSSLRQHYQLQDSLTLEALKERIFSYPDLMQDKLKPNRRYLTKHSVSTWRHEVISCTSEQSHRVQEPAFAIC